jgi:biotin transporter BioY
MCQWNHLIEQINRIISWLFGILTIAATLLFIYAGFIYLTSGGSTKQAEKAKDVLQNVVVGFIIVLLAWVIIATLLSLLVDSTESDGDSSWWEDWGQEVVPIQIDSFGL